MYTYVYHTYTHMHVSVYLVYSYSPALPSLCSCTAALGEWCVYVH